MSRGAFTHSAKCPVGVGSRRSSRGRRELKGEKGMTQYAWQLFLVILGAVLVPIFEFARLRLYVSPLYRKIFNFGRKSNISFIIPTLRHEQFSAKEFIAFTTPLEAVMTIQSLGTILKKLDLSPEILQVRFSQAVSRADLENNIILIGGPIHNSVSREFMKMQCKDIFF
jgi:hypothetical protein